MRQLFILTQIENLGEDLFAISCCTFGKRISLPLEQKGGIGKGLVGHAQQSIEQTLRLTQIRLGNGAPAFAMQHLQVELTLATGLTATFPGTATLASSAHPIELFAKQKLQIDAHLHLTLGDQLIITHPSLTPEGPGDGIKEGRFSGTILTSETDDMESSEIEGGWASSSAIGAIAHEVAERKFCRDHAASAETRAVAILVAYHTHEKMGTWGCKSAYAYPCGMAPTHVKMSTMGTREGCPYL